MAMKSVGKKFEVNDELIQKLDKGEIKFSDLDPETEAAVGVYLDAIPEEAAPADVNAVAQPAVIDTEVKQDEPVKPPKGFVDGSKYKEKADAASDFENKWKADRRRIAELEAALAAKNAEPVAAPTVDHVWSDVAQVDLHKTVAELKRELDGFKTERVKTLEEARAEKLSAVNETELIMLRSNPMFKDAVPADKTMEKMEAEYSEFYYATGATAEDATNVKKYFEDPNFRKEMEAKGVKPPKDFEKINTILQVKAIRDKHRSVDPDFKLSDAYVHYMAKSNKLSAVLVEERLKGAAQVADRLHANANETITMQPGSTSGATQDSWSDAAMMDWMTKHPHPKTKDEKATFNRICAILDERAAAI